jgi:hypothetical protein
VDTRRGSRKLREYIDGKSDVHTRCHVREHQFTKEAAVSIPELGGESIGSFGAFRRANRVIKESITVRQ